MKKGSDNHEGARDLVVFGQFCLLARTPTVPKSCILFHRVKGSTTSA